MSYGDYCENCGQPTNGWFFIMIQKADGTWIERVNDSDPEPSDLYCCYDCSEQLESPIAFAQDDIDDDIEDDWSTDADVSIYLLLKNKLVVYVGIGDNPDRRAGRHYRKKWHFDDVIETPDGPYCTAEAKRREKILIRGYWPVYNKVHNYVRLTKKEERDFLGWLTCWPEGTDALCARLERVLRNRLTLGTYMG
jgi:hypothetical protein